MTSELVSVVVPVYRNEETLRELHARVETALAQVPHELVFVVDASPDGSLALLRELAHGEPHVRALALERNVGQHAAILVGLEHARGDPIVVMDADLQDPPEAVPVLLAAAREAPVVFAGRRGLYESRLRLVTSRLFKRLNHLLCGVPADAGVFVALSREVVERVLDLRGPAPALVSMIGLTGVPAISVPVERARRPVGRSAHGSAARVRAGLRGVAWGTLWRFERLRRLAA